MRHDQRRAWVEVDLGALKRNASMLAQRARVPLLPMVKSDAYGLGVDAVVGALESLMPWGYGVGTIDEGVHLRSIGVSKPILVFTPILAADFAEAREHQLTPTLGDAERISAWHSSGGGTWHLAVDTGMNRAGVPWHRTVDFSGLLRDSPPEGAFTHFHSAETNDGSRAIQHQRFSAAIAMMPNRPKYLHAENSPAIERQSPSPWDLARPGVALYGVGGGVGTTAEPAAVASFHARIVELRDIHDGETVSYGATWRAEGAPRIATVAAGYADGIRRSLSNRGFALVRGVRVPIAGIVTMDMTMLDVTGVDCGVGDVATFLGRQGDAWDAGDAGDAGDTGDAGDAELSISEVSLSGHLSPYELLVGLGLRAPRIYIDSSS